jgi:hypothetical protein
MIFPSTFYDSVCPHSGNIIRGWGGWNQEKAKDYSRPLVVELVYEFYEGSLRNSEDSEMEKCCM